MTNKKGVFKKGFSLISKVYLIRLVTSTRKYNIFYLKNKKIFV